MHGGKPGRNWRKVAEASQRGRGEQSLFLFFKHFFEIFLVMIRPLLVGSKPNSRCLSKRNSLTGM